MAKRGSRKFILDPLPSCSNAEHGIVMAVMTGTPCCSVMGCVETTQDCGPEGDHMLRCC
jgi:hypothetical protein